MGKPCLALVCGAITTHPALFYAANLNRDVGVTEYLANDIIKAVFRRNLSFIRLLSVFFVCSASVAAVAERPIQGCVFVHTT